MQLEHVILYEQFKSKQAAPSPFFMMPCHFAYCPFDYCHFAYDGSPTMPFCLLSRQNGGDNNDDDDDEDFIAYLT